jgi:hypothetical protein
MIDRRQILERLSDSKILFVIVGGIAMRIYSSPRVTHDVDLAIKTTDADDVIDFMYGCGYFIVIEVRKDSAILGLTPVDAKKWVNDSKNGSMTFVGFRHAPKAESVLLTQIDLGTQVDFLFELGIPVMRLAERATKINFDKSELLVASPKDLLVLKEQRKDKTSADEADIAYLKEYIAKLG